jgi:hypothetical protein
MIAVLLGLLTFVFLCAASVAAGLGLLRVLRIRLPDATAALVAAPLTLALWTICLGLSGTMRLWPVQRAAPLLWLLTLGLIVVGIRDLRQLRQAAWVFAIALGGTVVVMAPDFRLGLMPSQGSVTPDGWSYVAYGQYLWEYARGTEGGLSPLHQYAAHLSVTRFISPSLLGFVSPLVGAGDTAAAKTLLQAWTLFVYACAAGLLWTVLRWPLLARLLAVGLTIVCGWTANLLWANNLDNGLALVYPAAIAATVLVPAQPRFLRVWLLTGGLAAALLYTYPELAIVGLGTAGLIVLPNVLQQRTASRDWILGFGIALLTSVVLVGLYLPEAITFVLSQQSTSASVARPGVGLFQGLVGLNFEPAAAWGLGGEHALVLDRQKWVGTALTLLAVLGASVLVRRGSWGVVVAALLLLGGAAYYAFGQHYGYASYKLLLQAWFILAALLAVGVDWLVRRLPTPLMKRVATVGVGGAALWLGVSSVHTGDPDVVRNFPSPSIGYPLPALAQVRDGAALADGPVLVLVDDWLAQEWAVYYLRGLPIKLVSYRMYVAQPHLAPFMARARAVDATQIRSVVADATYDPVFQAAPGWTLRWSSGPFRLWTTEALAWAVTTDARNTYGLERVDGQSFAWIGPGQYDVDIFANSAADLELSATYVPGPSLPSRSTRRITVSTDTGVVRELLVGLGPASLVIPVTEGMTRLVFRALDLPDSTMVRDSDPRALIVGVQGLAVHPLPRDTAAVLSPDN